MPRVFHCDDEPNYRRLVRVVLAQAEQDYEVVGDAADGREALDLAPRLRPDIVLLDVNMPGIGGLEALPHLREALPDARIIALTTSWRSAWQDPWHSLGGDAFIEKPRDALALPGLIDAALAGETADPLDVAEEMFDAWWSDDRERAWAAFAPDAEFQPLFAEAPIVGVAAARAHVESLPEPEASTRTRIIKMLALHDTVVVEGTAEIERGEQRERFPIAWVLRIRDGKIRSTRTFRSWGDAHEAAGLTASVTPTGERAHGRGAGWLMAVARRALGPGTGRPATA